MKFTKDDLKKYGIYAGISASLYTSRANLKTLVIGKGDSALKKAEKIENETLQQLAMLNIEKEEKYAVEASI